MLVLDTENAPVDAVSAAFGRPAMGSDGWLEPALSIDDFLKRDFALSTDFIEMIRSAVDNYPAVASAEFKKGEASAQMDQASAVIFPQVNGSYGPARELATANALNSTYPQGNRLDATLSVSQLLFDFGASFKKIDAAGFRLEAQEAAFKAQRSALTLKAVTVWLELIRARKQLAVTIGFGRKISALATAVEARTKAGRAPEADFLRANSRVADVNARIEEAKGHLGQAEANFREVFGVEPPVNLALPGNITTPNKDPESLTQLALKSNSDLRRQAAIVSAAEKDRNAAKADLWPKLYLNFSSNHIGLGENISGSPLIDNTLNFSFKMPLYDGGYARSISRESDQRLLREKSDYQVLTRETMRMLSSITSDLNAKQARSVALKLAVDANSHAEYDHTEQFRFGRRPLIELLDTERELFLSAIQLLDNYIDSDILSFNLLAITGQILNYF